MLVGRGVKHEVLDISGMSLDDNRLQQPQLQAQQQQPPAIHPIHQANDDHPSDEEEEYEDPDEEVIAMISDNAIHSDSSKLPMFSGSPKDPPFSNWLRHFNDLMNLKENPPNGAKKAAYIIAYTNGQARDRLEELSDDDRADFDTVCQKLRECFEGRQRQHIAKQELLKCRQRKEETISEFAHRISNLVKFASDDPSSDESKKRLLEEFIDRLLPTIRYYTKLGETKTFNEAVNRAQTVELLLNEANAEKVVDASINAMDRLTLNTDRPSRSDFRSRDQSSESRPRVNFSGQRNSSGPSGPVCYYCNIRGHIKSECRKRMQSNNQNWNSVNPRNNNAPRFNSFNRNNSNSRDNFQKSNHRNSNFNSNGNGYRNNNSNGNGFKKQNHTTFTNRGNMNSRYQNSRYENRSPGRNFDSSQSNSGWNSSKEQLNTVIPEDLIQVRQKSMIIDEKVDSLINTMTEKLEVAHSRIEALSKRNDDLAQTAYSNKRTTSSFPINSLCLLALFLMFFPSLVSAAYICPQNKETSSLMTFPLDYRCASITPVSYENAKPKPMTIELFRPNTKAYRSQAFQCSRITKKLTYSKNFFGSKNEEYTYTPHVLAAHECSHMAEHLKTQYGQLVKAGPGKWSTENQLVVDWPAAPFQCCKDFTAEVINDFVSEITVISHHHSDHASSTAGDLVGCGYQDGSCSMADGSMVVWKPDEEQKCAYTPVMTMTGQVAESIFLTSNGEFAVSWRDTHKLIHDCGRTLRLTDQGYCTVDQSDRQKRSIETMSNGTGVVFSQQFASQLLALQQDVRNAMTALFHKTVQSLCDRVNTLATTLHTAFSIDPTTAIRKVLNKTDVSATYRGLGVVEIHQCLRIPENAYQLIPFNNTCYSMPMILLKFPSNSSSSAFLDPNTGIIKETADIVSCKQVSNFFIHRDSKIIEYNPFTNKQTEKNLRSLPSSMPLNLNISEPSHKIVIFHNLVISNLSELAQEYETHEGWSSPEIEKMFRTKQSQAIMNFPTEINIPSFWSLFGIWSPYEIWLAICGIIVTLAIVKQLVIMYIKAQVPPHIRKLLVRQTDVNPEIGNTSNHPVSREPSIKFIHRVPACGNLSHADRVICNCEENNHHGNYDQCESEIEKLVNRIRTPLKKRRRENHPLDDCIPGESTLELERIGVLAVCNINQTAYIIQVPIRVSHDGQPPCSMLALVDSGASRSVASSSMLPLMGITKLDPTNLPTLVGVSGSPIQLLGSAVVKIALGNNVIETTIYITEGRCTPMSSDRYNLILGTDSLSKLPLYSIDFSRHRILMNDDTIPIINDCIPLCINNLAQESPLKVSCAETTVCKPLSETLIRCNPIQCESEYVISSAKSQTLEQQGLFVSPGLISTKNPHILVCNSLSTPKIIYKDQSVTSAESAHESELDAWQINSVSTAESPT